MRSRPSYRIAAGRNCDLAGIGLVPKLWAKDLPLRGQRRIRTDFPIKRCRAQHRVSSTPDTIVEEYDWLPPACKATSRNR